MIKIDPLTGLYPPLEAYKQGFLRVSSLHTLYYEESGNPHGIPVVYLHGGPGGGSKPKHRQRFNPELYRIILFDQRGSGKSTPAGEITDNTTAHSVADIEALRQHLGIDRWHVCGGSWGSTLGLVYTQTHPDKVCSLVVNGIFLAEKWMLEEWITAKGLGRIFPDAYAALKAALPAENDKARHQLCQQLLASDKREDHLRAAAFALWEGCGNNFLPQEDCPPMTTEEEDALIQYMRIFSHFLTQKCFLEEDQILKNAAILKDIPGAIIHGRYDLCCPLKNAWDLHHAWPTADFTIVHHAAHSVEPNLAAAITQATDKMAKT